MKKKIIGSLLCIGLAGITLMGERCPDRRAQIVSQFKISNAGVLQSLRNQAGIELLGGGDYSMREGYAFKYQSSQGEQSVHAVGKQLSSLTGQGPDPAAGTAAKAVARTADGLLEISSDFELDVKSKRLLIIRKIKNLSSVPVKLILAKGYLDPGLFLHARTGARGLARAGFVSLGEPGLPQGLDPGNLGGIPHPVGGGWQPGATAPIDPQETSKNIFKGLKDHVQGGIFLFSSDGECEGCPEDPICPPCLRLVSEEIFRCKQCSSDRCADVVDCCLPPCDLVCKKCPTLNQKTVAVNAEAQTGVIQVNRSFKYDAAANFLRERMSVLLTALPTSGQPDMRNSVYLVVQIELPAKFK